MMSSPTTTYLELRERATFRPALSAAPGLQLIEAQEPLAFYRFLYGTAGRDHAWIDRHSWSAAPTIAGRCTPPGRWRTSGLPSA